MFSRFFIERPIFASVVAIVLALAGLVAMVALPVEQYPTITPVQVTVTAYYPGADSKTLADSVAAPIEAQVNGVDNMLYMSSTSSSTGTLTITVYLSLDTDPDVAQVQVQNRVNLALPQLPAVVTQQPHREPEGYENIILRAGQGEGAIVRLKDVAPIGLSHLRPRDARCSLPCRRGVRTRTSLPAGAGEANWPTCIPRTCWRQRARCAPCLARGGSPPSIPALPTRGSQRCWRGSDCPLESRANLSSGLPS